MTVLGRYHDSTRIHDIALRAVSADLGNKLVDPPTLQCTAQCDSASAMPLQPAIS